MEMQISNEQAHKQVTAKHTEFDDKFSIEALELAFSDDGDKLAEETTERVKLLKDAVTGALWHKFKVLRNDFDVYVYWDTKFKSTLHNGILPGYKTSEGKQMYAWKSNEEQLKALEQAVAALKLNEDAIRKFALQTRDRNETRINRSGTESEARAFEPAKESKPYAKRDNEDAINEVEMRRFVNKQYQLYIRDSIKESRQALAMDIEDGVLTSKEAEAILDKLKRIA